MKIALVYDRVNKWGGAERVLLALHEMFPNAPLYTSVYSPQRAPWARVFPEVVPSFLQNLPYARYHHEKIAVLMPLAFESHRFDRFDVVISVTSEFGKGIITGPNTLHICYCLTPTRYLWSGYEHYFQNGALNFVARPVVSYLRGWDKQAAARPDKMIAISSAVRERIKKYYGRNSDIIYPPTEIEKFNQSKHVNKDKYFLVVSRMVSYKRIDLVVSAFNQMQLPLVVVGTGKEEVRLKAMAGKNIVFLSGLTDEELANYYRNARALVFPQIEDFGLTAVEAQAAGTPVIAYRRGGALETVTSETGVFFDKQDKESIISATRQFMKIKFDSNKMRQNAEQFSKRRFQKNIKMYINNLL